MEWCKAPEAGLLKPDLVILLTLTAEALAKRGGFGEERYEVPEFQRRVMGKFAELRNDTYWRQIDADKGQDELTVELSELVLGTIDASGHRALGKLW